MTPPAHGQAYYDGLPQAAALATIAGAGHAVPLEQPDRAADLVIEFRGELPNELEDMRLDEA
jgi:pimeloyl-ACP methyl ester carboxylesterase